MPRISLLFRRAAQVAFGPALTLWSWLLVKPNPFPETARLLNDWGEVLLFLATKTLHAGCYAVLMALVGIGWRGGRWRVWLWLLVMAHAPLSELAQYYGNLWYGTGRYGCLRDVFIDWAGCAAGFAAVWWADRRAPRTAVP